jgi:hypothetical protein
MKRHTTLLAVAIACLLATGCTKTDGPKVASAQQAGRSSQAQPSGTASPMPSPAADEGDRALQFQRCMHDHGIDIETGPDKTVQVQASPGDKRRAIDATEACQIYLPGGGEKLKLSPEDIEKVRQFSQCIRDHGFPDFPDPDPETGQMRSADMRALGNVKSNPQFERAIQACENLQPGNSVKGAK